MVGRDEMPLDEKDFVTSTNYKDVNIDDDLKRNLLGRDELPLDERNIVSM